MSDSDKSTKRRLGKDPHKANPRSVEPDSPSGSSRCRTAYATPVSNLSKQKPPAARRPGKSHAHPKFTKPRAEPLLKGNPPRLESAPAQGSEEAVVRILAKTVQELVQVACISGKPDTVSSSPLPEIRLVPKPRMSFFRRLLNVLLKILLTFVIEASWASILHTFRGLFALSSPELSIVVGILILWIYAATQLS